MWSRLLHFQGEPCWHLVLRHRTPKADYACNYLRRDGMIQCPLQSLISLQMHLMVHNRRTINMYNCCFWLKIFIIKPLSRH